jgi:hypothetical protein
MALVAVGAVLVEVGGLRSIVGVFGRVSIHK